MVASLKRFNISSRMKKPWFLLVGMQIEILHLLVVPIDLQAHAGERVEARVGRAGKEETVGARRFAEDDPAELELLGAREQFDVFHQVGEVVDDQRVGVVGGGVERLDHRAMADHRIGRLAVAGRELGELGGVQQQAEILHRGVLAPDGNLGFRPGGATGVARRILVEVLEELARGAEKAGAFLGERFRLEVLRRGAWNTSTETTGLTTGWSPWL